MAGAHDYKDKNGKFYSDQRIQALMRNDTNYNYKKNLNYVATDVDRFPQGILHEITYCGHLAQQEKNYVFERSIKLGVYHPYLRVWDVIKDKDNAFLKDPDQAHRHFMEKFRARSALAVCIISVTGWVSTMLFSQMWVSENKINQEHIDKLELFSVMLAGTSLGYLFGHGGLGHIGSSKRGADG